MALERDLEVMTRYVEFDDRNQDVFSIELAHLLFAAASEVDVVAKLLCEVVQPGARPGNINDYRDILLAAIPDLPNDQIVIARYGMRFKPWDNWGHPGPYAPGQPVLPPANPFWWRSYNNVKHQRDAHFHEATLKHALNALGALLILIYHLYARTIDPSGKVAPAKVTTGEMVPKSTLLKLDGDYYYATLVA